MSFSSYPLSSVLDGESLTAAMLRDMGRLPILLLALAGCGPSTPAVTSAPVGCGKDTDWLAQADHFVAASAAAALTPADQLAAKTNPAWKAAMQARMAKNCEMMETDEGEAQSEAERQYHIADKTP